jgi:hypothetical protein
MRKGARMNDEIHPVDEKNEDSSPLSTELTGWEGVRFEIADEEDLAE